MRAPWRKDREDPKLTAARREIWRAMAESASRRATPARDERPLHIRVLRVVFPLGLLIGISVIAFAPFVLMGLWDLWWVQDVSVVIWMCLLWWLAEGQHGKRLFNRYEPD